MGPSHMARVAPEHRQRTANLLLKIGFVVHQVNCQVRPDNLRRLKEFHYVAGRVLAENLFASRPLYNFVSELYTIVREL